MEDKKKTKKEQEIERYVRIVDFAQREITGVRSAYKLLAGILGIILVSGMWFTYSSFREMKADCNEAIAEQKNKLDKNFDELKLSVQTRVENELQHPNIQKMVKNAAKGTTSEVIREQIKPVMDDFKEKAALMLDNLALTNTYLMTVTRAQNNDRKAYEVVLKWAKDKSFPFYQEAVQENRKIISMHTPFMVKSYKVPWSDGVDHSKLMMSDLKRNYQGLETHSNIKLALIDYIWKREDLPKKERMQFLIEVIKNDEHLTAVEYAGRNFNKGAGLTRKAFDIDEFIKWWEENKDSIK